MDPSIGPPLCGRVPPISFGVSVEVDWTPSSPLLSHSWRKPNGGGEGGGGMVGGEIGCEGRRVRVRIYGRWSQITLSWIVKKVAEIPGIISYCTNM